jgi:integrase
MHDRLYRKTRDGQAYGSWFGWYYDPRGKRVPFNTRCRDRRAADAALRQRERQAHAAPGVSQDAPAYEVGAALAYFIEHGASDCAPETLAMYATKSGHLLRVLGEIDTNALKRDDVQDYINQRLNEGAAGSTLSKELVTLRQALTLAHERKLMLQHPAAIIPKFRFRYVPRDRYLSVAEFAAVFHALPVQRRLWMLLAVYGGPRLSEIERLRWEHVDLHTGWMILPGTKTAKAKRHVPLAAPLAEALNAIPEEDRIGPVVEPWANVRRDLATICDDLEIEHVSPNDLRRTFASWLKQAGEDSMVVAKLLGHTSSRMVELVYGHLNDGALARAVVHLPPVPDAPPPPDPDLRSTCVANEGVPPVHEGRRASRKGLDTAEIRVPRDGVEPPTRGFSVPCSTT